MRSVNEFFVVRQDRFGRVINTSKLAAITCLGFRHLPCIDPINKKRSGDVQLQGPYALNLGTRK
jgi:hypothetical protein